MLQSEQFSILFLTVLLGILFYIVGTKLKVLDIRKKPMGLAFLGVLYVETMTKLTVDNMGEKHGKKMAAYIGAVFIMIIVFNMSGLLGLSAPTSNFSVTLTLALITWIMIQWAKVSENGVGGYFKSFFEPFAPFVIPNVFGTIAPLISLSLRLFGNILSGTVIMTLLYSFTAWLSAFVPLIGGFNFIGVVVAPVLHLYFDMFSAFLQAFIFISLTSIMIAVEYQE